MISHANISEACQFLMYIRDVRQLTRIQNAAENGTFARFPFDAYALYGLVIVVVDLHCLQFNLHAVN